MVEFGWTEKQLRTEFTKKRLDQILIYLSLRNRVERERQKKAELDAQARTRSRSGYGVRGYAA